VRRRQPTRRSASNVLYTSELPVISFVHSTAVGLWLLNPSTAAVPHCCCLKGSAPHWSNPPFLIFDIRSLWHSASATECQKLKMVGYTSMAKCKVLTGLALKGLTLASTCRPFMARKIVICWVTVCIIWMSQTCKVWLKSLLKSSHHQICNVIHSHNLWPKCVQLSTSWHESIALARGRTIFCLQGHTWMLNVAWRAAFGHSVCVNFNHNSVVSSNY